MSRKYLSMAAGVALTSNHDGPRHGAIVVKDGRVVGVGANRRRGYRPFRGKRSQGDHAEAVALRAAGNKARGATLVVARINRRGDLLNSAPCVMCSGLIGRAGISRIVHS